MFCPVLLVPRVLESFVEIYGAPRDPRATPRVAVTFDDVRVNGAPAPVRCVKVRHSATRHCPATCRCEVVGPLAASCGAGDGDGDGDGKAAAATGFAVRAPPPGDAAAAREGAAAAVTVRIGPESLRKAASAYTCEAFELAS